MLAPLFITATVLLGQTNATQPADLSEDVRALVRQLDADQLRLREEAERSLIELGPQVLPHLPAVNRRMSAELEVRLQRVRMHLERAEIESATKASTVTLSGTMPLSKALEAIQDQTGNTMLDYRNRLGQTQTDPEITLDVRDADYWSVIHNVFDQAELKLYAYTGKLNSLAYVARNEGELPATGRIAHNGLFRFEAVRVQAMRDLRNPTNDNLRLAMEIAWEPRVLPIALTQSMDAVGVLDDRGNSLTPANAQRSMEVAVQNTVGSVELEVPFGLPERGASRISSLRGKLVALLPGRKEEYRFDRIESIRNAEQRKGGATVIFQMVRKNGPVQEAMIRVRFDNASNALESHRGWIYNNDAYLLDENGQRVNHVGFETTGQRVNEIGLSYKFVLESEVAGHSFVYETPAAIVKLPVEYELMDIKLP